MLWAISLLVYAFAAQLVICSNRSGCSHSWYLPLHAIAYTVVIDIALGISHLLTLIHTCADLVDFGERDFGDRKSFPI